MKPHRCFLIIDGSNFYFKLKDLKLQHLLEFDFSSFAQSLARTHRLVLCRYYVGAVRTSHTEKTKTMHADQQKLFAHLVQHLDGR